MIHTERLPRSRLADFSWEHPCTSMVPRASTSKPAFNTGGRLRQAMADFCWRPWRRETSTCRPV